MTFLADRHPHFSWLNCGEIDFKENKDMAVSSNSGFERALLGEMSNCGAPKFSRDGKNNVVQ